VLPGLVWNTLASSFPAVVEKGAQGREQERNVLAYMKTGNLAELQGKSSQAIPYPDPVSLASLLSDQGALYPDTPVGAFGTMFWFRPKALRKLFEHKWKWTDFNAEPDHIDGGLAHVLERLICYVAQDARYTTQQIISSHLAGWNYAMLEYKLQKLSAAMPDGYLSNQCSILEEWKRASHQVQALTADLERIQSSLERVTAERDAAARSVIATKSSTSGDSRLHCA
jgi:hypothetical protein